MEGHKTKKYCSKRQRENSVLFSHPSLPPCFLLFSAPAFRDEMGTVCRKHHRWTQWTRCSPSSAAPEQCRCTGGSSQRPRGCHPPPSCPTPRDEPLRLLGSARVISSRNVLITNSHQLNCCRDRKGRDTA